MLLFTAMNTLHIDHHNVAKTKTKPDKLNTVIAILRRADNADTQSYGDENLIQNVKRKTVQHYLPSSGCVILTESLGM